MNKAIKYRIYPTEEQMVLFQKTFGCCRKIWNLMLSDREKAYRELGKKIKPTPAKYKDEYPYLREVDSLALSNVQLDLEQAYKSYLTTKGIAHPRFKSRKHSKDTYTTNNQNGTVKLLPETDTIRLPKLGYVKAKLHRLPPEDWRLKSATISRTGSGNYYCAALFEYEADIPLVENPEENAIELDYKSNGFYADSDGGSPGSPAFFRKAQGKLTREQRKLRHKVKGSRNYEKQKQKIARCCEKTANQRKDFLHKESLAIAKRYDLVAVESLNMKSMSNKGFGNGKATMDNGWGLFTNMLAYKLADRGKYLYRVEKWFPSSQACHVCGYRNPLVKNLNVRHWVCPECKTTHDRDVNAAINIREEGIRMHMAMAT